jgi:two-component system chemotaxis response regulator CheB
MKILIVDDSAVARAILTDILKKWEFITEVETARNGKVALDLLQNRQYDLILLDVEMPIMDGLTFLKEKKDKKIITPTIMLSSYTQEGAEITLKALELGAIDFIPKPASNKISLEEIQNILLDKVKNFYFEFNKNKQSLNLLKEKKEEISVEIKRPLDSFEIILIGSSTGGPKALTNILSKLSKDFPLPIAIVQHMPEYFTLILAKRLNEITELEVFEAEEGKILEPGKIVVAKGNNHLLFEYIQPKKFRIILNQEEKVNAVRPSIDRTLKNLIEITNAKVIAIILTGMGRDGVDSCKILKERGGLIIAQDESTSIIFGMNKRAIEENSVNLILPDYKIPEYLIKMNEF